MAETGSQQTNHLLQLVADWLATPGQPSPLEACLRERLAGMEQVHHDFTARAGALGQGFLDSHAALIETVQYHYSGYEATLDSMLAAYTRQDRAALQAGAKQLAQQTDPLLEAMKAYGAAYLHYGPSPFPLLNLLERLREGLQSGQLSRNEVLGFLGEAHQHFAQIQKQLEVANLLEEPGWHEKWAGVRQAQDALQKIEHGLRQNLSLDKVACSMVESALERIHAADEAIYEAEFLGGPTAMPAVNLLLNCARGRHPLEDLKSAVSWYMAYSDQMERDFEAAVAGPTNSAVLLEQLPKSRQALDALYDAVEDLKDALADFDPEGLEPILVRIEKAAGQLYASYQVFEAVADQEGKLRCPLCSHANSPGLRVCQACGGRLAQIMDPEFLAGSTFVLQEESEQEEGIVTANVAALMQACAQFHDGKISLEELTEAVELSRSQLHAAVAHMQSLSLDEEPTEGDSPEEEPDEGARRLLEEGLELFLQAVEEWEAGLDLMLEYGHSHVFETLETGIARVWVASQKVARVHRIGEVAEQAGAACEAD